MAKSLLEPYVTSLLTDKKGILDHWRRQKLTLSNRTKNFENWLLVELVDRLLQTGKIIDLKTNGNLSGKKIKACDVAGLNNRKFKAVHLSPDIDIRLKDGFTITSEIKTGLAPKDLLNDLKIVKHYKKIGLSKQIEFVWVTLLPAEDIFERRAAKSFEKTYQGMLDDKHNNDLSFIRKEITPWMILVVAISL